MKKLLIIGSVVIFVAACNDNGGWSTADREKGMKSCLDGVAGKVDDATAKKYCSCVLGKIMPKYKTYEEADKALTEEDGRKLGLACAAEIQGEKKDDGTGLKKGGIFGGGVDGWSDADKQKFMNTCLQNAMNTGADEQTSRTHCDCTLKKIQEKYKSYAEADQKMTPAEVTAMEQECNKEQN